MSCQDHVAGQDAAVSQFNTREGKKLFDLPRRIAGELKRCKEELRSDASAANGLKYLWATFRPGEDGVLNVDDWMNVVDETASLGLTFIVFSVEGRLNEQPELWAVCRWAQDAYDITVGVHTTCGDLSPGEVAAFKQLNLLKARLYVSLEHVEQLRHLEDEGIMVRAANPRGNTRANPAACCDLPRNMIYVDEHGVLFTCKYVRDNDAYCIGHFCDRSFKDILDDPSRPAVVPADAPFVEHGCDGCPPIVEEL